MEQGDIIVNNYDTSLNKVCYLTTSVVISGEHLKLSICQGNCVYFTTRVATIHIITSGLWLIREKLNNMFIWRKLLLPCSFKGAYIFPRTSCTNICLKSAVLNARKYFQSPHCLLVDVVIFNFTTLILAIHSV